MNPLLKLADLAAIAELAARARHVCVADNTFATPFVQRPLTLGLRHRRPLGDQVSQRPLRHDRRRGRRGRAQDLAERLGFLQNAVGGISGPFDSFLALRGVKTLALRMERHCDNALRDRRRGSSAQPTSSACIYPGLPSRIRSTRWPSARCSGFGGMVSVVLKGGAAARGGFLERCELFTLAESLGGVESLIEHPALMTHASIPPRNARKIGIDDGLVRLSVGIEDVDDLIADLDRALS